MDIFSIYRLAANFRKNRMEAFLQKFKPTSETRILDVGGFYGFWKDSGIQSKITILRPEGPENLPPDCPANFDSVQGDGCDLKEYQDGDFDIVFSNSVIEHVGEFDRQIRFANEAARVGKSYWVQTPAMEFPIEPHLLTPFYHYLPRALQEKLYRFTVWGVLSPNKVTLQDYHHHSRAYLLSRRRMTQIFPGTELLTEKLLGLPKSYVACRKV